MKQWISTTKKRTSQAYTEAPSMMKNEILRSFIEDDKTTLEQHLNKVVDETVSAFKRMDIVKPTQQQDLRHVVKVSSFFKANKGIKC